MKNLLVFTFLVLVLTSCSKDSLDLGSDNLVSVDKSEIFVTVTYMTWSDLQCDLSCSGAGTQSISYVSNAKILLYTGDQSDNDESGDGRQYGTTGVNGSVLFKDLEPGQYTLVADTPYGEKTRTIYTQLNRRSSIEFSF